MSIIRPPCASHFTHIQHAGVFIIWVKTKTFMIVSHEKNENHFRNVCMVIAVPSAAPAGALSRRLS